MKYPGQALMRPTLLFLCTLIAWCLVPSEGCSSDIKTDEAVIFFPALAYLDKHGTYWHVDLHGWIYEPELTGEITELFRSRLGLRETQDPNQDSLLKQRAHWFTVDNERGKRLRVRLGERTERLNASGANGHFYGHLHISAREMALVARTQRNNADRVHFEVVTPKGDTRRFGGDIYLIRATGVSVISDIDDTIKVSEVHDKLALLENTFVKPFQPVAGMAVLYTDWERLDGAVFHYVTASPWQLYLPLSEFLQEQGFPAGSLHMRLFRWKDSNGFNLFKSSYKYKISTIESLFRRYPQRRFILVGDAGEQDPEIYGEVGRRYRDQIIAILIRETGHSENGDARFVKAFAGVPKQLWQVFRTPGDILLKAGDDPQGPR
jgi:hypothetical protein